MTLSYWLTPVQRIANPPERMLYVLLGIGQVLLGLWLLMKAPVIGLLVLLFVYVAMRFVFGKPTYSLYLSAIKGKYINTLSIDNGWVNFGVDGIQAALPGKTELRVSKGLFRTFLIRSHGYGYSWVVPDDAVTFAELRNLRVT